MSKQHCFSISKMNPARRSTLRPLLQTSWSETYVPELGQDIVAELVETLAHEDIGGLIPNNDETVFVAKHQNQICGCSVSAARNGVTYLWGFYILREFQRMGIGQRLLKKAVLEHDHANSAQLTVLTSSTAAVKFYSTAGFKPQGKTEFEIFPGQQLPAIQMSASVREITHK
ncbi:GNAT family N-acetyltransferase [Sulfitobacter sp. CW3]|uniref:GNAT family N-acetyltransferase n=1 Tax=Sulfitobacter sp. CW3 TaxID=2861965 RepID=UPI001C604F28|nr:GNAT family N-acetyltransferase [Sulfitobacter sp. CW3]MBW4960651.1 GNAT family N-acetyltransferase [Sulfitobacter sp. CW3]